MAAICVSRWELWRALLEQPELLRDGFHCRLSSVGLSGPIQHLNVGKISGSALFLPPTLPPTYTLHVLCGIRNIRVALPDVGVLLLWGH